jgi:ATP-dependent helicase HrpB
MLAHLTNTSPRAFSIPTSDTMSLPVDSVIPDLRRALSERHEAILVAEPGAGKTTRVPLALLDEPWLGHQRIVMLEPRRLAARAAAQYLAQQLGEAVGATVGYRMRLDNRESASTRLLVVTEGVLSRMLQSDPSLGDIGLLIFDEFHERSLDADLGLALTLYGRRLFRDEHPLKILVMSATLDSEALATLLEDAPVIRSEGRGHPVSVRHAPAPEPRGLAEAVAERCLRCLREEPGSVLAFLPGQAEIRRAAQWLEERVGIDDSIVVAPLYGDLDLAAQQRAIAPPPEGQRKVVLATTLAESSLTIDGVSVVVDGGYTRVPRFDPRTGMTRLHTVRVSQASAVQRAGRAGRQQPGVAWRLWPAEQQTQLAPFTEPEIRQTDLAPLALQLLHWGVTPEELCWLDSPPPAPWQQALDLLQGLGACERDGEQYRITAHGEVLASLPLHPRLAHMLVRGAELGMAARACDIAALLGERDPLTEAGADIAERLALLDDPSRAAGKLRPALKRLRQQAAHYRALLKRQGLGSASADDGDTGVLVALAYPDRIAQQRAARDTRYRLASGRMATLREEDPLRAEPWLAVAQVGGRSERGSDSIFLAAALDPARFGDLLTELVDTREVVEWQDNDSRLVAERQWRIGELVVRREPLTEIDATLRQRAVLQWLRRRGLAALPWHDQLRQWRERVACLREQDLQETGGSEWPDLGDDWLLDNLDSWLLPFLGGITDVRQLQQLDLSGALHSLLPWPLPQRLDELAPTHYTVPTGSRIRIDYSQRPPVLAVKLQEMFGQRQTPTIAKGRIPLMLHLLSPAGRPLQVTQDLTSFWQNAYHEVRKDMKGRYPKHPWPEDPLSAAPQRGTKRRPDH